MQRRTVVLLIIIAAHILLIYGFSSGLVPHIIEQIAPPIETTILKEEKPKDDLPPPPPPKFEEPPVQVVASEIPINISVDAPPPPISVVTTQPVPPPPPRVIPGTKLTPISSPNPDDMYPSAARNAGQEGRPVINFCTDERGRITTTEVAESSTFPLLDEAAMKVVRGGRFKPATQEGKAIASCARIPVKFQLKKS
jgi:protein TonB